jgi:hypothetical protein
VQVHGVGVVGRPPCPAASQAIRVDDAHAAAAERRMQETVIRVLAAGRWEHGEPQLRGGHAAPCWRTAPKVRPLTRPAGAWPI